MKPVEILLVEDNRDHADLTQQSLESGQMVNRIHWVKDGQEAIDFIFRKGAYANAPRPGLVILDIRLPKLSGLEVLKKIKENEETRTIPVIMLTTSDNDDDALKCYSFGANSFVTKPVKFDEFFQKIQSLKLYWLLTDRGPISHL